MAKGLKMFSAKKKHSGELIKIIDINPDNHGDFVCESCGVDIKYTRAYAIHASDKEVAAYLSLKPNLNHKGGCKYNITVAIQKIVNFAQSVEEGDPCINTEDDGTHVYRLNFLEMAINQISPSNKQENPLPNNEDAGGNRLKIGTEYVLTNKQVASYFRSAIGVAKIKSLLEDQNDEFNFKKNVKIRYKAQNIKWEDFYFEKEDYKRLYDRQFKYPISAKVFVKDNNVYNFTKEKIFKGSIRCSGLTKKEENKTIIYSIFLKFNDNILASQISSNTSYLILGKPLFSDIKEDKTKHLYYKTINIEVLNENQIKKVDG